MAKDKNSTNKNQISKAHRNLKRPQIQKYASLKGVNARFLRNRRRVVKNDPNMKSKDTTKKIEEAKKQTK